MSSTTFSSTPRILVFDSGVGGLSIFTEIQKKLPNASLIYASDNAAFPYGTKGEAELIERVDSVLRGILAKHTIDIIVIACNTASTLTLPHVRSHFSQPVVGVVPAIKPAATLTKTGVIGLLATPATVARPYTHTLIEEHAQGAEVISVGSSELVHLAEHKLRGGSIDLNEVVQILNPFFDHARSAELDVIVLACTHFPLLKEEIAKCFLNHVQLIDSGEAIARRVVSLVDNSDSTAQPAHIALFTKVTPAMESLRPQLHQFGIHRLDIIDIPYVDIPYIEV